MQTENENMSFVINARSAFEQGYLYDNEYIMLLSVHKGNDTSWKQEEWIQSIANRIEADIKVQSPQSLKERPLRSLKVVDPRGNVRRLTSFDPYTVMADEDLVETSTAQGKRRIRSASSLRG